MTLRTRLACVLGLVGIIIVGAVFAMLGVVRANLIGEIDRQLRSTARIAAGPLSSGFTPPPTDAPAPPPSTGVGETSWFTEMFIGDYQKDGTFTIQVQGSDVHSIPEVTFAQATPTVRSTGR